MRLRRRFMAAKSHVCRKTIHRSAYQGRGIGAVALRAKTNIAAERGLPTELSVLTTNPADRFYMRESFTLETETHGRRRFSKPVA